jgi:putative peptidoglycan lipid II flippase
LILALSVPVSLLIFWQSEAIVSLLFERGAFGRGDTHLVGEIQRYYALQIPFWILGTFFARLLSALRQNRIMLFGALINLPLNVVLNFAFIQWLDVAGISLSTSVVLFVSCCYLGWMARKHLVNGIRGSL